MTTLLTNTAYDYMRMALFGEMEPRGPQSIPPDEYPDLSFVLHALLQQGELVERYRYTLWRDNVFRMILDTKSFGETAASESSFIEEHSIAIQFLIVVINAGCQSYGVALDCRDFGKIFDYKDTRLRGLFINEMVQAIPQGKVIDACFNFFSVYHQSFGLPEHPFSDELKTALTHIFQQNIYILLKHKHRDEGCLLLPGDPTMPRSNRGAASTTFVMQQEGMFIPVASYLAAQKYLSKEPLPSTQFIPPSLPGPFTAAPVSQPWRQFTIDLTDFEVNAAFLFTIMPFVDDAQWERIIMYLTFRTTRLKIFDFYRILEESRSCVARKAA